jgi:signal transduction histidine kinase
MADTSNRDSGGGEVVYRRSTELAERSATSTGHRGTPDPPRGSRRFAPTLRPLAVGFALLLAIVAIFGLISVRELEKVESETSILQEQFTSRLRLYLDLNAAAYKVFIEARIRAAADARREMMPPFELKLRDARNELRDLLKPLEGPPYSQQPAWSGLREKLARFLESTNDLETYDLTGFVSFRDLQDQLKEVDAGLKRERAEVTQRIGEQRFRSTKRVKTWWATALVIALLVIVATIWEVQRRFRHEQESMDEARRERHFSTQMLEGMVSAVAAIDARGRIRSANSPFFALFPEASVGTSVYDKFGVSKAMGMLEGTVSQPVEAAAYRGRWVLDNETQPGVADKSFDIYSSPLEMDGEMGQIVTLVDVSEAVEAEVVARRTEALAAVGQASAQVAHEIKNPLGSIRLGVSMLRDMTDDNEAITTIDLVERGIDHLNKLVVDVTHFSRQRTLNFSEFDLNHAVAASFELVTDRVREKNATLERHFTAEALKGKWDEDQLMQVFVNLIGNAIDASPKGSTVTITTERVFAVLPSSGARGNGSESTEAQPAARVIVKDMGIGMDEATRVRIFEPFFTTKKRGTGLGLAIVKQIVDLHGGTISVESAPDAGTRFIVDLPLKPTPGDVS